MTASDMLRRTLALQGTLQRLVELLQADELTVDYCDDLDAAVLDADTLLSDLPAAAGYTATAERQAAPTRRPVKAHGGQSAAAPATGERAVKGYCHAHYYRVKKHGDPLADVPIGSKPPGKPLAGPKAPTSPTEGSVPPGGPSGSKPDSAGSTPARPAQQGGTAAQQGGNGSLSDDEKERLRRRASDLRDTNPAQARRIVALLHGEGLPA